MPGSTSHSPAHCALWDLDMGQGRKACRTDLTNKTWNKLFWWCTGGKGVSFTSGLLSGKRQLQPQASVSPLQYSGIAWFFLLWQQDQALALKKNWFHKEYMCTCWIKTYQVFTVDCFWRTAKFGRQRNCPFCLACGKITLSFSLKTFSILLDQKEQATKALIYHEK